MTRSATPTRRACLQAWLGTALAVRAARCAGQRYPGFDGRKAGSQNTSVSTSLLACAL